MRKGSGGAAAIHLAQPFICCVVLLLGLLGIGKIEYTSRAFSTRISHARQVQARAPVVYRPCGADCGQKVLGAQTSTSTPPNCSIKPCLALTFDDGPDPTHTPLVLDILANHHATATFFVVGVHVPGNGALLKRMHDAGHEIGNHSWGHLDMTTLAPQQIRQQIYDTQAAIAAAGVPVPHLFRPPYGAVNDVVRSSVPLTIVQWNIDPEDWANRKQAQQIIEHIDLHAKPGGVVIMHDTQARTVQALDILLTDLEKTYQFITVSDLLHLAPGQSGVYYGR
ncbi:MAG TPA: polysaccharide deacetylase family protein [Candidatus Saccharimonadales bacterium]|nr:polysaccharide deacetylase family protein [Candidatus Saccharimonadales bacterium]